MNSIKAIIFHGILVLYTIGSSTAQTQLMISGRITDASTGEGLIGASVILKGNTSVGTVTDFDGNYSLDLASGTYTLAYSYIGYSTKEKDVSGDGSKVIDVKLEMDIDQLDEIIVIGYGESRKGDIAGAVSSVSSEDFNKGVIVSPEQLLQGKVSGLQISATSGEPGAAMNISIRGLNSVRAGSSPLFVVDGIPLSSDNTSSDSSVPGVGSSPAKNPLNFLNPSDIKSIQVLKDASATAIYGSRASNGVIIIETKSGSSGGETTLEYSTFASVAVLANKLDLLTGDEFREQQALLGNTNNVLDPNASIDWQDEIFRPALTTSHNITFGSGSENSSLSASIGVLDQEGIIEKNTYNRYSGRINATSSFLDKKLKLGFNIIASHTNNNGIPITNRASGTGGDLLINTLRANPTTPNSITYDEFGSIYLPLTYLPLSGINPLVLLDLYHDKTKIDRVLSSFTASIKPIKGMEIRTQVSVDRSNSRRSILLDPIGLSDVLDGQTQGYLYFSNSENRTFLIDNYITYGSSINKFTYKVMIGHSYQKFFYARTSDAFNNLVDVVASGIKIDYSYNPQYYTGSPDLNEDPGINTDFELQGIFSRFNLSWDDRYLLEATIRRDGSTKFGGTANYKNNEFGIFPSAAFRWKITNESFLENLKNLADLSARVSWGQTGDQNIPINSNIELIQTTDDAGNFNQSYGNPTLTWETQTQTNFGLDFNLFENTIYGNVDYFNKVTSDLLFQRSSPFWGIPGGGNIWGNTDSEVHTSGFEFLVGGYPINKKDVTWDISLNVTSTRTSVRKLNRTEYSGTPGGPGVSGADLNIIENGKGIRFFLFDFQGFDEDGRMIIGNEGNKMAAGSVFPDFSYGINSALYIKNFDIIMNWTGVEGQEIFNSTAAIYLSSYWLKQGGNVTQREAENQPSDFINTALPLSTYYLENGDFLRLNNLQIGYTFSFEKAPWLDRARIYFAGQNLLLFTKYSGYDPEVNTNLQSSQQSTGSSGYPSYGIDASSYPKARTFTVGINVNI